MADPITPPPELVQRLCDKAFLSVMESASRGDVEVSLILEAYAAGADQELEACCTEVSWFTADILRAALATPPPEPPTDEELQALWHELFSHDDTVSSGDVEVIARAALERWGQR